MNAFTLMASFALILGSQGTQGGFGGGGFGGSQNAQSAPLINVGLNEPFPFAGLRYRVLSVRDGLVDYTQKYDQRQSKLSPGFKRDRLAVVELEVENPNTTPSTFSAVVPGLTYGEGSMTDRPYWDVEQKSFVRTTNILIQTPQDTYLLSADPILIAPQGKLKFALVFSIPAGVKATRLTLQPGQTTVTSGTVITYPVAGSLINVNLSGGQ